MANNPWLPAPTVKDDEIEAQIARFKESGGEVIELPENYSPTKAKKSSTAVLLGKHHRQLREIQVKTKSDKS